MNPSPLLKFFIAVRHASQKSLGETKLAIRNWSILNISCTEIIKSDVLANIQFDHTTCPGKYYLQFGTVLIDWKILCRNFWQSAIKNNVLLFALSPKIPRSVKKGQAVLHIHISWYTCVRFTSCMIYMHNMHLLAFVCQHELWPGARFNNDFSPAIQIRWKFCSDHCIWIEMRVKRNFHRIWISMEKPVVKQGPVRHPWWRLHVSPGIRRHTI